MPATVIWKYRFPHIPETGMSKQLLTGTVKIHDPKVRQETIPKH